MNRLCDPLEPVTPEDRILVVRLWREASKQQGMETSWRDAVREFDRAMFIRSYEAATTGVGRR